MKTGQPLLAFVCGSEEMQNAENKVQNGRRASKISVIIPNQRFEAKIRGVTHHHASPRSYTRLKNKKKSEKVTRNGFKPRFRA